MHVCKHEPIKFKSELERTEKRGKLAGRGRLFSVAVGGGASEVSPQEPSPAVPLPRRGRQDWISGSVHSRPPD
eukprot:scaffold66559_cov63-Phaeocystis_antarctica.AAC.4